MPATNIEQLMGQMADFMNTRFFGKYRGIVTDISDPVGIGRITAQVPAVFGESPSPWAMPASPFGGSKHGLFLLPEVNDGVWIEFEGGNPSLPIWSGFWWGNSGEVPDPKTEKARALTTSAGHQLVLDDDENVVSLLHAGGGQVTISDSDIVISIGQCEIKMTASEINVNNGMLKITTAGASLVNDAFKVGA